MATSTPGGDADLMVRLGLVERRCRRLQWAATALAVTTVAAIFAGAARPKADVVSAQRFEVVNNAGDVVGLFGYEDSEIGRKRDEIWTGPRLIIGDPEKGLPILMGVGKKGGPKLSFHWGEGASTDLKTLTPVAPWVVYAHGPGFKPQYQFPPRDQAPPP